MKSREREKEKRNCVCIKNDIAGSIVCIWQPLNYYENGSKHFLFAKNTQMFHWENTTTSADRRAKKRNGRRRRRKKCIQQAAAAAATAADLVFNEINTRAHVSLLLCVCVRARVKQCHIWMIKFHLKWNDIYAFPFVTLNLKCCNIQKQMQKYSCKSKHKQQQQKWQTNKWTMAFNKTEIAGARANVIRDIWYRAATRHGTRLKLDKFKMCKRAVLLCVFACESVYTHLVHLFHSYFISPALTSAHNIFLRMRVCIEYILARPTDRPHACIYFNHFA